MTKSLLIQILYLFVLPLYTWGQASNYGFSATSGTYATLTGTTNASGLNNTSDDVLSNTLNIGFTFNFAGTNYTQFKASSNGWITFDTSNSNAFFENSSTNASSIGPVLMPLWDDLQSVSRVKYKLDGTAPNQIFKIQYTQNEWDYQAGGNVIEFQIWLYETTNVIEYIYQQGGTAVNTASGGATIGIYDQNDNYITLSNSGTAPTAQNSIFTTNIVSKPANGQIYRFTPPIPIAISPTSASICDGSSVSLTASSANPNYTYVWSPSTGLNTTSGATVIASPSLSTVYTVTGTDGTMQFSENITVTNNSPNDIDISTVSSNVCPGSIIHLQTNAWDGGTNILLEEDFTLPVTGWLQYNGSVGGTPANAAWAIYPDGFNGINSNDNSDFVMSDSDAQGFGGLTYTLLFSPTFDLTNLIDAELEFYQFYDDYNAFDFANIQVSTDAGITWEDIAAYTTDQGTATSFLQTTLSLNAYLGFNSVQIRFEYYAEWGYNWAIDNVSITGTKPNITWVASPSSPNSMFTDALCATAYVANTHADNIYVNPSATTTYTASTSIGSCSKSDNVTLSIETATYNGVWTPALSSNQTVIIDANYSITSDVDVCACLVNTGRILTIPSGTTLTVQNAITNSGEIIVNHEGSLVQVNETDANTGSGLFKIQKTTGTYKNYDYFYWSSPVENETVGSVLSATPYKYTYNPANYLDTNSGAGYPQTTSGGDGYDDNANDWSSMSNATNMPKGIGFIAMGVGSPTSFSVGQMGVSQAAFNVTFEGEKIHNGTFTAQVYQDAYTPSFNANNNNLNLLGNPYPSAIDVYELYHDNASVLEGKFYFWTHDAQLAAISGPNAYDFNNNNFAIGAVTGTYPSYTYTQTLSGTGKSAPRYIASTQGFMASALDGIASPSTVTYKNSMRTTGNNNTFLRQASDLPQVSRLWLNMTGASSFNQIAVGFDTSTSDAYGMGDAPRVASAADTDFYSIIPEVTGAFAIQFLSDFQIDKLVPLGISVLHQGAFEITLDHVEGVFNEGQIIYLEDTYLDVIHNLSASAYSFTQTAGMQINDRFILRFTNSALGHEDSTLSQMKVYPNPSTGVFNVSYQGSATLQYTVYDLTGKTILSGTGNQIDLSRQAIGMYFAKITDGDAVRSLKLVRE
jgi:hypothetical protein